MSSTSKPLRASGRLGWPQEAAVTLLFAVVMVPIFLLALLVAIPLAVVSKLTGWGARAKRTRESVSLTIEQFLDGGGGRWDWDDFISVADADPFLERARRRCVEVAADYPAQEDNQWCAPEGLIELRRIAKELRDE